MGQYRRRTGRPFFTALVVALASVLANRASAQTGDQAFRFEMGLQVVGLRSGEFGGGDPGIGGRFGFRPAGPFGIEAELNLYPRAFPRDRSFSRRLSAS